MGVFTEPFAGVHRLEYTIENFKSLCTERDLHGTLRLMNPLESWLNKLESRLQLLVEGTAERLLPAENPVPERQLADELLEQTSPLVVEPGTVIQLHQVPPAAFLVVDGVRIFPLEQPVVCIGRAPENDLVITDMRVSLQHAQLRAVGGRFVIFDLDSTGGTSLNGLSVLQHPLTPGDVISLAGIPLVYGQENHPGADLTQELHVQVEK
jgi:hypothetical protein